MAERSVNPNFVDNQDGNTLSRAIKKHLKILRQSDNTPDELCISTAYFNPNGLQSIAEEARSVGQIKLLLGAEPTPDSMRPVRFPGDPQEPEFTNKMVSEALKRLTRSLKRDRNYLPFDLNTTAGIKNLLEFLSSGKIEVRRYEGYFLHAKAFIFRGNNRGLLAGSSNLTYAGMNKNLELNLGHYDNPLVGRVESWFDDLWDQASPYDLTEIYEKMLIEIDPYMVYIRVLFELYAEELFSEIEDDSEIPLTSFQKHGMLRAERILEKYGGVIIADGVGLGKTFTSGDLIRKYRENRQRVLLICPASLRDTEWKKFLNRYQLFVDMVSYEQLANDAQFNEGEGKQHLSSIIDEYSLVVIDEGHNYRNPDAPSRAGVLRQLLQGKRRDVVFLTATPVNNSLWDLYHLLRFFLKQDASLSDQGIRSIRGRFNQAMSEDPFDLNPDLLFPIIDATTVKRTRRFIKNHYLNDTIPGPDGKPQIIKFPKPHALSIKYNLDAVLPGFFEKFRDYLMPVEGLPLLTMARYKPEAYPKNKKHDTRDTAIIGLLRSIMLKRFESSAYAFRSTLNTMIKQHEAFLKALDKGHIIYKEFYKEWSASDDVDIDELLSESENTELADRYNVVLLKKDVSNDIFILKDLLNDAEKITRKNSKKLDALIECIVQIIEKAEKEGIDNIDRVQRRKVLIFSYYEETVDWIEKHLNEKIKTDKRLSAYKDRLVSVSGRKSRNNVKKSSAISGFAPISTKSLPPNDKDKYDIMIATDVLAEGMNLQQCSNIINIDLPWNPMRLIQRHGRIDRIGSTYSDVYMYTFFPDDELDSLLDLERRVRNKLAQAAASVGVEETPIEGGSKSEHNFSETEDEIKKLSTGDSTFYEEGGTKGAAQTGEEYRQELRKAIEKYGDEISDLAWKIGSGMVKGENNGIFFCAKVGNRTYLRFIGETGEVIEEIGTCLRIIECTENTERHLDLNDYNNVIQSWEQARENIYNHWMHETDPANLEAKIPKINRLVAEFLRTNPPKSVDTGQLDHYLDIVETPWSRRETNILRRVFNDDTSIDIDGKVNSILSTIDKLGIEPTPPQDPLPPITKDEVYLICWLSIHKQVS